jgi:glyoxylase-like metal-dependent hydrolase (beta-lactamase superfamily II)
VGLCYGRVAIRNHLMRCPFPIDTVLRVVSKDEKARDLQGDFLRAPVQGSINAFLVNTGAKRILIDAGAHVQYGDCYVKLLASLRSAGYTPRQVDQVSLTHFNKDRVGGIAASGAMTLPNAVVRVSKAEPDH